MPFVFAHYFCAQTSVVHSCLFHFLFVLLHTNTSPTKHSSPNHYCDTVRKHPAITMAPIGPARVHFSYESLQSWMAKLENTPLELEPLEKLFMPGSHDSGAYVLYPELGFSMDKPKFRKSWLMNTFHFVTYPIIHRYSITQRLTVYQQLQSGVRYLDLRVAVRPEDEQFYVCHNFYGPKLEIILEQIKLFTDNYPKEIVVLDFQHLHNFTETEHLRLYDQLVALFGDRLVPNNQNQPISLRSLWSHGQQMFIFYRHHFQMHSASPLLWNSEQLPNPWPNTRNPVTLKCFLESQIAHRPKGLFVAQGVLTPNTTYVMSHIFGTLESKLSYKANLILYELVFADLCAAIKKAMANDEKNKNATDDDDETRLTLSSTIGKPSIIMFDFIDWEHFELPRSIVQLNYSRLC